MPYRDESIPGTEEEEEEDIMYACVTYIPEIAPQLKRALAKAGVHTTFKSAPKLKDLLCSKNRTKPPMEKKKGVYKYTSTCSDSATYVGQTGRSYELRWDEHQKATHREEWHHSGLHNIWSTAAINLTRTISPPSLTYKANTKGSLTTTSRYMKLSKFAFTTPVLGKASMKIWAPM